MVAFLVRGDRCAKAAVAFNINVSMKHIQLNDVIVAFDPGETTGCCIVQYKPTNDDLFNLDVLHSCEIPWKTRHEQVDDMLDKPFVHRFLRTIVVEKFRLYPEKAQSLARNDFPSVIVEGIIEHAAYERDSLHMIVYYNAGNRLGVLVLPQHQAVIGKVQHRIDAYQHARYHLIMLVQYKLRAERRKQELIRGKATS